jgi:hypothetical protein
MTLGRRKRKRLVYTQLRDAFKSGLNAPLSDTKTDLQKDVERQHQCWLGEGHRSKLGP